MIKSSRSIAISRRDVATKRYGPPLFSLADDHPIMRDGLKFMLAQNEDITVVCQAADGVEAVEMFAAHRGIFAGLAIFVHHLEARTST